MERREHLDAARRADDRADPRERADPPTPRSMPANASAACEAANELARSEHPDFTARKYLTKAIMCDVKPFCATEVLFATSSIGRIQSCRALGAA